MQILIKMKGNNMNMHNDPDIAETSEYQFDIDDDMAKLIGLNTNSFTSKKAQKWAKENGLSQEAFSALVKCYIDGMCQDLEESESNHLHNEESQLLKLFGSTDSANRKINEIGNWLDGLIGQKLQDDTELAQAIQAITSSHHGIRLLDLLKQSIGERNIPNNSSGRAAGGITFDELKRKMNSDAYFNPGHPEYENLHRQVKKGFHQLYV